MLNQINELKQVIEGLKSENKWLKSKLEDYQTQKNSNNSSKPPSSDFGKLKKTNSLKTGSGKKVGGQPMHKGSSMKMTSSPDFTEIHHPSYCNCCGNDLSRIEPELLGKRQVVNIPEIIPRWRTFAIRAQNYTFNQIHKANWISQAKLTITHNQKLKYIHNI